MLKLVNQSIVAAFFTGFFSQLNYIWLESYVDVGLLIRAMLLLTALLFVLNTLLHIRVLHINQRSMATIAVLSSVSVGYFFLLAIAYGNTNVFSPLFYILFTFFLFKVFSGAVSVETRKHHDIVWKVIVTLLAVSFALHFSQAGQHLTGAQNFQYTGARYGTLEGRSIINITAANLAYALSASAVMLFAFGNRLYAILFFPAIVLGVYALFATASFSAILSFAYVLLCLFLSHLAHKKTIKRVLVFGFVLFSVALVVQIFSDFLPNQSNLFLLLEFRLSDNLSDTVAIRLENIQSASELNNIFFGQGVQTSAHLGRSADNMFAATVVEIGLIGLAIVFAWFFVLTIKHIAPAFFPALSLIGTSLIQALSEDHFVTQSTVLTYSGLLFAHWFWSKRSRSLEPTWPPEQAVTH